MNVLKLKGRIVESGMKVEQLARKINIDRATLYRKLNKGDNFTVGEVQRIKDALGLTNEEAIAIFLE